MVNYVPIASDLVGDACFFGYEVALGPKEVQEVRNPTKAEESPPANTAPNRA
jgi:hypothetical protein